MAYDWFCGPGSHMMICCLRNISYYHQCRKQLLSFFGGWWIESPKQQLFFEIEVFCISVKVFTVSFGTPNVWTANFYNVFLFLFLYKRNFLQDEKNCLKSHMICSPVLFVFCSRHWLATYFVIWYGVPYMSYDIFAMYLSHYHRFRVKGLKDYKSHSLQTFSSFVRKEFLLVLHHIALLTILLPVTLVREREIERTDI